MARYIQKLSFGVGDSEWWVGWEIAGAPQQIRGLIPADSLTPEELRQKGVSSFQPVKPDLLARIERRTVQRVRLLEPLTGRAGGVEIRVVDISAGGIGICHQLPLRPGKVIRVDFMAGNEFFSTSYDLLRCSLSRGNDQREAMYYSALRLKSPNPADREMLSRLVAGILALNESAIREDPGNALALY